MDVPRARDTPRRRGSASLPRRGYAAKAHTNTGSSVSGSGTRRHGKAAAPRIRAGDRPLETVP
jgi:hypothetical protein